MVNNVPVLVPYQHIHDLFFVFLNIDQPSDNQTIEVECHGLLELKYYSNLDTYCYRHHKIKHI